MPEKRDSFGRSEKGLQRQNSSTAHMEAPRQFHSFQRSREMRENPTPSEGVQGRFSEKVAFREVSCDRGAFLLIVILSNLQLLGFEETFLFLPPLNLVQRFGLKEHTEKDTHKPAQRYFVGQDALLLTILFSGTCVSAPLP